MFENCRALKRLDIESTFNTSAVTDMSHMFEKVFGRWDCASDLSSFDTSAVSGWGGLGRWD